MLEKDITFEELLQTALDAAIAGKEASKQYIAKFGRQKRLVSELSVIPDAGAVSLTLIMKAMLDWVKAQ